MPGTTARFVWYELMTADAPGAEAFYKAVVGWGSKDSGMPGGAYTLMLAGAAEVAGVMATSPALQAIGVKPAWSGFVAVDDVDATAARVVRSGGKVLRPAADIPQVGRFAVVADPQQASFMLFKPLRDDPRPLPVPGAVGTTGWHELCTTDWKAAFDFYATLFGWTPGESLDMGPMGTYQLFEIDGVPGGGMMNRTPDSPAPGWRYYFNVDTADGAAARIAARGGRVVMGPHQVPGGTWVVQAVDPQGVGFAVMSAVK